MTTENVQIKEYSATEAGLAQLREKYAGVKFDLATKEGDEEARSARRELVKLRTSLEAKRKELKAPALAYAMAIDSEAKRITAQIKELEEPIDGQIKAEEQRKAAEKAERERIERERVQAIQAKIEVMRGLAHESAFDTSEQIAATLADLSAMEIADDEFAEFTEEAAKVQAVAIEALSELLGRAKEREAEHARLAAERAELERQRQEQEAREAAEREAREAEARKLAEERAEFERQRAEFEAQRAATEKPVQEAVPVELEAKETWLAEPAQPAAQPENNLAGALIEKITFEPFMDGECTLATIYFNNGEVGKHSVGVTGKVGEQRCLEYILAQSQADWTL